MRLRRSLRLTIYVLFALAGLYTAAWYFIADRLENGIARWVEERRADGWTVKHGDMAMGGYPLAWRATISRPQLSQTKRQPGYHWSGNGIVLDWKPWKPDTVAIEATGLHRIGTGTGQHQAMTSVALGEGVGRLIFAPTGVLHRLELLIDGVTIGPDTDRSMIINRLQAVIDQAPATPKPKPSNPHLIPSVEVKGEIFGLTLPKETRSPLGRTVGRLAVHGVVMGRIPQGRPAEVLSIWQKDGGTLEISHLELGWASLVVQGAGTLALDAALQPVGALTGKVSGYNETLDALVTANMLKPGPAMVAKFALGALSRTPSGAGRPEIDVPLSMQDGWLFVGPVKLLKLPRIRWH